jgi:hypothetical protein
MHVWKELDTTVTARLAAASEGERAVFATGVAERLLRAHETLPPEARRPFTVGLRPLLDAVWAGALGDASAFTDVKQAVGAHYLSDYFHNYGQDGPGDADEHAAAAVLCAAETYLHGYADFAVRAGGRAVEAVGSAGGYGGYGGEQGPAGPGRRHDPGYDAYDASEGYADDPEEALAEEVRRQLRDLDLIAVHADALRRARFGLAPAGTDRLREALRGPLSRPDDLP